MLSRPSSLRWCFNAKRWNPNREQFIQVMARIQPEERRRVVQFVFKREVKPTLIGRLMLRYCLTKQLGILNKELTLDRSDKGKPILSPRIWDAISKYVSKDAVESGRCPPIFDFNLSHQGDYVALAFDVCAKVGIDTMKIEIPGSGNLDTFEDRMKRQDTFYRRMVRQFSQSEWSFINDGLGHYNINGQCQKLFRFMRLWSLKESYVKAEGFGITIDLKSTSFTCPTAELSTSKVVTDTTLQVNGQSRDGSWLFEECLLDTDHCVSIALKLPFRDHSSFDTTSKSSEDLKKSDCPRDTCSDTLDREVDEGKEANNSSTLKGDGPERTGKDENEKVSTNQDAELGKKRIFYEVPLEEMINNLDPISSVYEMESFWNEYQIKMEKPN